MAATTAPAPTDQRKRKESIVDLTSYLEKSVRVKFAGGREATGILKGFDPLLNLVIDDTVEHLRDPDDPMKLTEDRRHLGLVVCRGTSVVLVCPSEGMEQISNPFVTEVGCWAWFPSGGGQVEIIGVTELVANITSVLIHGPAWVNYKLKMIRMDHGGGLGGQEEVGPIIHF